MAPSPIKPNDLGSVDAIFLRESDRAGLTNLSNRGVQIAGQVQYGLALAKVSESELEI